MSSHKAAPVTVEFKRLPHGMDLPVPAYSTPQSAGLDLVAALDEPLTLTPGARSLVPTGISMALPVGHEGQIRPRSGLAAKYGITVLNTPGTIDSDYRGEIMIILINLGNDPVTLRRGERVAQMVIAPISQCTLKEVNTLDTTKRGSGGFGSTGV